MKRTPKVEFPDSEERLRGVNLGGWLVLERWITPSLFSDTDAIDEYTLMKTPGAKEKLVRHRDEFITEADFAWLAKNDLNAVRIPVGYWVFDGDEPYLPAVRHLDWAVDMAEKYNLKVLVDLHAAKGSQNGKDHSGRAGQAQWFKSADFRRQTIDTLVRIAERYKDTPAVWGIELLNEPTLGIGKYITLRRFYNQAHRQIAAAARPGTKIVFSDGFLPWAFSGALWHRANFPPVMDIHWYQSGATDINRYFNNMPRLARRIGCWQRCQPVIIGEWSGMLSRQALAGLPEPEKVDLQRQHIFRQLEAFKYAAGWFYWTYKTEDGGIWDFREQVRHGVFLPDSTPVLD